LLFKKIFMSTPFRFKQFSIDDSLCAMKVGVDAVLLGASINVNNAKTILDIGTGTGIIALMLAQKSKALIDAVEIDNDAYEQAKINIDNAPWQSRMKVHHCSIQDYCLSSNSKYDLIVSNPPFFINSFKAPDANRQIARHTDLLSQEDLISSVIHFLAKDGRFCLILPYNEAILFKNKAANHLLYCNKTTYVQPKENKSSHRLLMEYSFNNKNLMENKLVIEEAQRHHYTDAYKELTKDYYLAF